MDRRVLFPAVLFFALFSIVPANAACVSSSGSQVIRPVFSDGTSVMYCPDGDNWSTLLSAGAGVPAGSTGQIQFNNAGAFAADSGLHWDNANKRLGIGTATPGEKLEVNGNVKANQFCNSSGVCVDPSTLTPSGAVMYFARGTCPSTWSEADGAAISRSTYASLFSAIGTSFGAGNGSTTFNVPDLRGEFVRGWDNGRGADSGRSFGTAQAGSNIVFPGYVDGDPNNTIASGYADRWAFAGQTFDKGFTANAVPGATVDGMTLPPSGSSAATITYVGTPSSGEITTWNVARGARPRNVALLACIKQ
ncbi:MAG: phage tail protein [Pseudomonadota bacterium]